jgi:NAD-dependent SIR2 family protein deacetylase
MSTDAFEIRLDRARELISGAGRVLVGGGAGLSDAAGIKYSGRRFTDNFGPFIAKYGLTDMYSATFYHYPSEAARWAYMAKHICVNRYDVPATDLYVSLHELLKDKDCFVLTTNVERQFTKAGFAEERFFGVQGDYGKNQCEQGCHDTLYDNEALVHDMVEKTVDCKIPESMVPVCPVCGGRMAPNLRKDDNFIQGRLWYEADRRYGEFIRKIDAGSTVLLELGVGFSTPGIIRYPFERLCAKLGTPIIRLNDRYPDGPTENRCRTVAFTEDMQKVIGGLLDA